ncbi:unnamed protein product [Rangifer tarandus platyrhynchus]|uniref:Uncharacterized protein n=1 Tax=Rangifer tarandus platyrhynchus TaxID=3082113 RepID=A0ABN8YJK3_RANTA|nr:unnamed protein product [Rangifer tarandus platyrhynchus]
MRFELQKMDSEELQGEVLLWVRKGSGEQSQLSTAQTQDQNCGSVTFGTLLSHQKRRRLQQSGWAERNAGRHGDASQTPAAEEGGERARREAAAAGEAGARAPTPASGPVARPPAALRASLLPPTRRGHPSLPAAWSGELSAPVREEQERVGAPRGAIRGGDAGTRSEDERRKAAQKLTRVGATVPGRRRHEPDRGDALAECTRRAERAQVGLSSPPCAPLPALAGRRMGAGAQGPCPPLLPLSPPRAPRPAGALRSWTAAPGWRRRAPGL